MLESGEILGLDGLYFFLSDQGGEVEVGIETRATRLKVFLEKLGLQVAEANELLTERETFMAALL